MFSKGEVVRQDYQEALRLYRLAAAQGSALAQHNLAEMYADGHGVAQDWQLAAYWYRLAAEQGSTQDQVTLGY